MSSRFLRALACSLLISSPALAASIVTNGSFEQPNVPGQASPSFQTLTGSALTGWTISSGSIDLIGSYWQAQDGSQSIDLSGNETGTIYQDLATTPGAAYTLSFYLAGNPDGAPTVKNVQVSWDNAVIAAPPTPSFDTTGHSKSNMGWAQFIYNVVATGTTTRLEFKGLDAGPYGAALDNVSVEAAFANGPAAVPLPAAAPAGLALLGGLAFRRRNASR